MSLTKPPGPLSAQPTPEINYTLDGPKHRILFEPHPRRIRAEIGGVTVLDTVRGRLLHESNIVPVLYAPVEDFDETLLERTEHVTHCPFKGEASYWSVRVGDHVAENAIWAYEDPIEKAAWLRGYASMYWSKAEAWFEEDVRVFGHLRDPYHRVDIRASSRSARVLAGDEVVAESAHPVLLFETNMPVRAYFRRDDVRGELIPSDKQTICPYKGTARYWSLRVDGETIPDAVWSYEDPLEGARGITGLVSFLAPGVDLELEGAGVIAGVAFR